ncbi:MAG: GNAT family N-acetyltransferase [Acidobacteria bacterium]|nr:GNAT family N-acetyltransferase [Acidobacteriota bacterium]
MTIRPARTADREALAAIVLAAIRSSFPTFLPTDTLERWLADDAVGKYVASRWESCHVAEEAGEVVACCFTEGDLLDLLMVHPGRQGRGIGGALLADAEARLFEAHPVIRLESFAANTAANRFYEARGWRASARKADPDTGAEVVGFRKKSPAESSAAAEPIDRT